MTLEKPRVNDVLNHTVMGAYKKYAAKAIK